MFREKSESVRYHPLELSKLAGNAVLRQICTSVRQQLDCDTTAPPKRQTTDAVLFRNMVEETIERGPFSECAKQVLRQRWQLYLTLKTSSFGAGTTTTALE